MSSIKITNLSKIYADTTHAVKHIHIDIQDGEFIVLVGPSGCGKSTLLRMIAGLETISEGDLYIGDKRVNDLEPAERDIAMVFQNYALYPHMTVYKNMAYGLKNRGMNKADIDERVRHTATMLEISEFLDRKPKALSGGQRQRVAMGRALVREPAAFLLDEPLSNLDAKLRVQMRVEIKQLQRRLKTTSLYVTHDQLEAMTLGDRLVVLNQGRIEQIGAPLEVYQRPETLFVAGFIGSPSMNLIPVSQLDQALNQAALAALPAHTDMIGIRPDKFSIHPPETPYVELQCSMTLFEPAGTESHLYMALHGNQQNLTMRVEAMTDLFQQTSFNVYAEIRHIHPFNNKTGRRTDL